MCGVGERTGLRRQGGARRRAAARQEAAGGRVALGCVPRGHAGCSRAGRGCWPGPRSDWASPCDRPTWHANCTRSRSSTCTSSRTPGLCEVATAVTPAVATAVATALTPAVAPPAAMRSSRGCIVRGQRALPACSGTFRSSDFPSTAPLRGKRAEGVRCRGTDRPAAPGGARRRGLRAPGRAAGRPTLACRGWGELVNLLRVPQSGGPVEDGRERGGKRDPLPVPGHRGRSAAGVRLFRTVSMTTMAGAVTRARIGPSSLSLAA